MTEPRQTLRDRIAEAMLRHHLDPSRMDADGNDFCVCGWSGGAATEGNEQGRLWDIVDLAHAGHDLGDMDLLTAVAATVKQTAAWKQRAERAEAALARKANDEMRFWCSPHGFAARCAAHIAAALVVPTDGEQPPTRRKMP